MAAANGVDETDGLRRQPGLVSNTRNVKKMTKKRERQLTTTVLLIVVSFFVCFLPSALIGDVAYLAT